MPVAENRGKTSGVVPVTRSVQSRPVGVIFSWCSNVRPRASTSIFALRTFVTLHALPAVNATLNGISAILLVIGYVLIRARRFDQHRRAMLAAFTCSSLFLVC